MVKENDKSGMKTPLTIGATALALSLFLGNQVDHVEAAESTLPNNQSAVELTNNGEEAVDESGIEQPVESDIPEDESQTEAQDIVEDNEGIKDVNDYQQTVTDNSNESQFVKADNNNQPQMENYAESYGVEAKEHVDYLSNNIGQRVSGTDNELKAKDYIANEFKKYGYQVEEQPFTFEHKGQTITSHNIIAYHPEVTSSDQVIVGAHYDSVADNGSKGADDNASGIGVMLETAHRLFEQNLNVPVRFIAFGGEEMGLQGSKAYVNQMSEDERRHTLGMINLDSLIGGDYPYLYAGLSGDTYLAYLGLSLAKAMQLPIQTSPGLNPEYPAGRTGDWSDHAPFKDIGIPVAYLESTNWGIGDLDGYNQTVAAGPIMHTERDNLAYLEDKFPGRVEERLMQHAKLLYHMLLNLPTAEGNHPYRDNKIAQLKEELKNLETNHQGLTPSLITQIHQLMDTLNHSDYYLSDYALQVAQLAQLTTEKGTSVVSMNTDYQPMIPSFIGDVPTVEASEWENAQLSEQTITKASNSQALPQTGVTTLYTILEASALFGIGGLLVVNRKKTK